MVIGRMRRFRDQFYENLTYFERHHRQPLFYKIKPPTRGTHKIGFFPYYASLDRPLREVGTCWETGRFLTCGQFSVNSKFTSARIAVVEDECSLGIQTDFRWLNTKLPPMQFYYRNPNCRVDKQPPPKRDYKEFRERIPIPPNNCTVDSVFLCIQTYSLIYNDGVGRDYYPIGTAYREIKRQLIFAEYPYTKETIWLNSYTIANFYAEISIELNTFSNGGHRKNFTFGSISEAAIQNFLNQGGTISGNPRDDYSEWRLNKKGILKYYANVGGGQAFIYDENFAKSYNEPTGVNLVYRRYEDFARMDLGENYLQVRKEKPGNLTTRNSQGFPWKIISLFEPRNLEIIQQGIDFYGNYYVYQAYGLKAESSVSEWKQICGIYEPKTPPPPPDPKCCKDMGCCPDNSNIEQLLRLILKKIGSDDLPASVPTLLTDPTQGVRQIQNLAQFISYTVLQLDALTGKFPVEIEIEDADLTEQGNQPQRVKLPNIAETLAEIVGLLLVLRSESDATLSASIRTLIEAGSAKQAATIATEYAQANAEYLGYKGKQANRDLPMAFTPGKEKIDELLTETTIKYKGWENDDSENLNTHLAPLLELAAMWKAQNFRNLGTADPQEALLALLARGGALSQLMENFKKEQEAANPPDPNTPKDPNTWDGFLEQAEQGFIAQAGITDNLHPYGRDFERRPRIREIGIETPDNTDEGSQGQ